jgi:hypothetical protein
MIISARGCSIRSTLAKARQVAGLLLKNSREVECYGGDDGLYRIHLADGTIVEATSAAYIVEGA